MLFQKVTILGVGLLGGSLGLAIKQRRLAVTTAGYVRRSASVAECKQFAVVDNPTRDIKQAVADSDLVVLCTPLSRMRILTEEMLPALKPGAIVTDVGSVKGSVVADIELLIADAGGHFIGSHPMAGGERMGVSASRTDLFENAVCVVTPSAKSNAAALCKVEEFWRAVGMRVLKMSPELHDELVSRSSHLPHVIAAELANYVLSPTHPKEQAMLCATGFRDVTRIASGSPEMWRDIAMANREKLSTVLGVLIEDLQEFQRALDGQDAKVIEEFFVTAKKRRDTWRSEAGGN
ncbi:MAG: prephenate dehydrogenase/arogenate dehydrogenase family protein [Verrucomicrobia bacterium]|nr:prephenate dehydrogenase/arogenate dehydrogenase family protein [Verrucomicrobiota bacterium]